MLLFLAFTILLLGTSLAQDRPGPANCQCPVNQEVAALKIKVTQLEKDLTQVRNAFSTVQRARSFWTGSDQLFVSNGFEGNFEAVRAACTKATGRIPSPKSANDNSALQKVLKREKKSAAYLIPDRSGFSNWAAGESQNTQGTKTCVKIGEDGKWRAAACTEQLLIVCQFGVV